MDQLIANLIADASALGATPDPPEIAALVRRAVADEEYWAALVARMGEAPFDLVHWPAQGVRVAVAHRTDGTMSAIHSHGCWVALTSLQGVETHRHYRPVGDPDSAVRLAEEQRLLGGSGDMVTLLPPDDIHSHGHLRGSGQAPYALVVLGDAQERFVRREYDPMTGGPTVLPVGEPGALNMPVGAAERSPL